MDILKAEIMKKRKLLEDSKLIDDKRKYFKRGELVAKEEQEYREKYGITISELAAKDHTTAKGSHLAEGNSEQTVLARSEVVRRLRDRCEPILMFGETELEAFRRLRKCEILEPEMNKGFRNDFQEAMEQVDQAFLDELLESSGRDTSHGNHSAHHDEDRDDVSAADRDPHAKLDDKDDTELTYDGILEMAKSMGRGNRILDMKVIMMFLQFLLRMWGDKLNNRAANEKSSTRGKMAGATYTQTQVYLKPLLRKLKTASLPEDISDSLTDIVRHLLDRNYLQASDAYLQMAIGNAPWPIGVTMVGIHARTGREKIFSKNVAHVMNDETQRKYIQALKRLMTKCQEYFPTDPSRCVEYAAFDTKLQP